MVRGLRFVLVIHLLHKSIDVSRVKSVGENAKVDFILRCYFRLGREDFVNLRVVFGIDVLLRPSSTSFHSYGYAVSMLGFGWFQNNIHGLTRTPKNFVSVKVNM